MHRLIHVNGALFARFETIEVFNSKKKAAIKMQQKNVCRKTIVRETDEQYCNCASRPMRFMIIALAAISSTVDGNSTASETNSRISAADLNYPSNCLNESFACS